MGFGGAVSAMVTSLKNNSRTKRKTFFEGNDVGLKNRELEMKTLLDKKATPEQLVKIRNEIIVRNRKEKIKSIILISIISLLIISAFLLFNSIYL